MFVTHKDKTAQAEEPLDGVALLNFMDITLGKWFRIPISVLHSKYSVTSVLELRETVSSLKTNKPFTAAPAAGFGCVASYSSHFKLWQCEQFM